MTLDDLGSFCPGIVPVFARAAHEFFRQFRRKLVDENSFLERVWLAGHYHGT